MLLRISLCEITFEIIIGLLGVQGGQVVEVQPFQQVVSAFQLNLKLRSDLDQFILFLIYGNPKLKIT